MNADSLGHLSLPFDELLIRATAARARGVTPRVAFDCDKTLIEGDIGEATLGTLTLQKRLPTDERWWSPLSLVVGKTALDQLRRDYIHTEGRAVHAELCEKILNAYKQLCQVNVYKGYLFAASVWIHHPQELISQQCAALTQSALMKPISSCPRVGGVMSRGVRVRPLMKTLIRALENEGIEVWVVSSSQKDLVVSMTQHLGVPANQVIGIDFSYINGLMSDVEITPCPIAEGKVTRFLSTHNQPPIGMFGDSQYDLPLMRAAGWGLLIDHNSVKTRSLATAIGAHIIPERWVKGV